MVVEQSAGAGAREVECGVLDTLGDGRAEASVPAEIVVDAAHDFYDFSAKYLPEEATRLDVPADLDAEVAAEVGRLAVEAFEVMSCEGLARVDFFLLADGRLVVNEINTMPGFTPSSLFPRMWAASGVDYPALVERLVQLALQPAHRPALTRRRPLRRSGRAPARSPRPVRTGRPAPPPADRTTPRGSPRRPPGA